MIINLSSQLEGHQTLDCLLMIDFFFILLKIPVSASFGYFRKSSAAHIKIIVCVLFHMNMLDQIQLGDNCIQNFHLGRCIVGYTVGNLVLRRRVSGAVKHDFRTYIRRYTSTNENFEYGYPHSNALLAFSSRKDSGNVLCCAYTSGGCHLHKTACQLHIFTCQPMRSDVT